MLAVEDDVIDSKISILFDQLGITDGNVINESENTKEYMNRDQKSKGIKDKSTSSTVTIKIDDNKLNYKSCPNYQNIKLDIDEKNLEIALVKKNKMTRDFVEDMKKEPWVFKDVVNKCLSTVTTNCNRPDKETVINEIQKCILDCKFNHSSSVRNNHTAVKNDSTYAKNISAFPCESSTRRKTIDFVDDTRNTEVDANLKYVTDTYEIENKINKNLESEEKQDKQDVEKTEKILRKMKSSFSSQDQFLSLLPHTSSRFRLNSFNQTPLSLCFVPKTCQDYVTNPPPLKYPSFDAAKSFGYNRLSLELMKSNNNLCYCGNIFASGLTNTSVTSDPDHVRSCQTIYLPVMPDETNINASIKICNKNKFSFFNVYKESLTSECTSKYELDSEVWCCGELENSENVYHCINIQENLKDLKIEYDCVIEQMDKGENSLGGIKDLEESMLNSIDLLVGEIKTSLDKMKNAEKSFGDKTSLETNECISAKEKDPNRYDHRDIELQDIVDGEYEHKEIEMQDIVDGENEHKENEMQDIVDGENEHKEIEMQDIVDRENEHKETEMQDIEHDEDEHKEIELQDIEHGEDEHKEIELQDIEHGEEEHKEIELQDIEHGEDEHKEIELQDIEHGECKHKEIELQDIEHGEDEHKEIELQDIEHGEDEHKEIELQDIEHGEDEHKEIELQDIEHGEEEHKEIELQDIEHGEDEHKEIELQDIEHGEDEHKEIELQDIEHGEDEHKETEIRDFEHGECEHKEIELQDIEHGEDEHKEIELQDIEHGECKHKEIELQDIEHGEDEHKEIELQDIEHGEDEHKEIELQDIEHGEDEHKEIELHDIEHGEDEHKETEIRDFEHGECEHKEIELQDIEHGECKHKEIELQDIEHGEDEHKEIELQDIEHGEDEHKEIELQDIEHGEDEHKETEIRDFEHGECEHKEIELQDIEHGEDEHKEIELQDIEHGECKHKEIELQNIEHGECKHKEIELQDIEHGEDEHKEIDMQDIAHREYDHKKIEGQDIEHVKVKDTACRQVMENVNTTTRDNGLKLKSKFQDHQSSDMIELEQQNWTKYREDVKNGILRNLGVIEHPDQNMNGGNEDEIHEQLNCSLHKEQNLSVISRTITSKNESFKSSFSIISKNKNKTNKDPEICEYKLKKGNGKKNKDSYRSKII